MPKDQDDAVERANEEALKELHEGAREAEEDDDGPKAPVVEPQDPEELEAKEEPRGEAKRRNRYREQADARERAERENNDLKIRLAAMEAAQRYAPQSQQQTETKDEHEERIATLKKDQADAVTTHRAILGDTPEAEAAREVQRQKYIAAQDGIQRTLVEQAIKKQGGSQQPVDIDHQVRLAQMRDRYADVVNHNDQRPLKYADSIWRAELVRLGRVPNQVETDRIFDQARRQFGLAVSPQPSAQVKARFSGTPQGARATNGVVESTKKSYPMSKEYLRMARAAHPGKPDKVAFQLWVNDMND